MAFTDKKSILVLALAFSLMFLSGGLAKGVFAHPSDMVRDAGFFGGSEMLAMEAKLSGRAEMPANESMGTGSGMFILDKGNNLLYFSIEYSGLEGAYVSSHIHGPATPEESAEQLIALPQGNPIKGVWNYDEKYEDYIENGWFYVSIRSDKYPEGEIRGQVEKVRVMPIGGNK